MPFKATVTAEEFETLDPAVAAEYKQTGDVYAIQVTGMVPKKQLDDFRRTNIELKETVEKFDGIDPEVAKDLLAKREEIEANAATQGDKVKELVETRVAAIKKEYDGKLTTATNQATQYKSELEKQLIDAALVKKATELGLNPAAIDDLVARGGRVFKLNKDGKTIEALDEDGNPVYLGSDQMTIDTYVVDLTKKAPHLFAPSTGGGTEPGNKKPGAGANTNPWSKEYWNFTAQSQMVKNDRNKARQMAAAAGHTVNF